MQITSSSSAVSGRRPLRKLTAVWLTGTALVGVTLTGAALAMLASTPAQAFGGPGTGGGGNGGAGGFGGSNGTDGQPGSGGAAGGLGGTSPGADGSAGSDDAVNGGGGGGGGAGGADTSVGTLNNTGVMIGGKGGNGGAAGLSGGGGGGGGAGGQISITGTGAMSNSGTIIGGAAGNGGSGNGGGMDGVGARGGSGLVFTMGGVTFTNSGTIIGGASGSSSYVGEVGGNGILAISDITVVNSGSIAGGMSGDGSLQGPAIFGRGNVSVHNTGSIVTASTYGIVADLSVTVTNAATGLIQSGFYGIDAHRSLNITNDGAIFGGSVAIINGGIGPGDTVINRAGNGVTNGIIRGDVNGIFSHSALTVTNSGAILGTAGHAIGGFSHITVTNYAGDGVTTGIISGGTNGITGFGASRTVTVTNAGTITGGNAAIQANGVAKVSNTGIISGGYGIVAGGGNSSVLNAGTITGSIAAIQFGGSGNTLTMATGSTINGLVLGTGSDTLQLGGTGVATFDISALSNSGQYQGFSTLNKVDSSIWTLSGTSTYGGDVNVNGGTLVVNGNLSSAGIMIVNPGGTLSGTGIVPFTLLGDSATLAPGPANSTGTLTINDRVRFCACSTYAVKVSGPGNDLANIVAGGLGGGDAFLGGLVRVTSPTASYRFNSAYTILSAQGGLNGTTFDSLVTPTATGGVLTYTASDVLLTLTSQLGKVAGLNANQQSLAARLDTAFNTLGSSGGLGGLFTGNIARNLTQASGETATGSQQTTFTAMTQFMNTMTDPFMAGRGFDAPGASGFADEDSSASAYASTATRRAERDAYAMLAKAPLAKAYDPRWSMWAAGFGGSQTTDGNAVAGSNAATSRIGGVAVGADYRFSPSTIAGFALTGGGTSFNVANGGSGRSDLFQAGAFVRHTMGAAYLTAAAAYGWQDVTTNRTVIADQLQARFTANAFSGRVEGGYRAVMPWIGGLGLTPYAAGQFATIALPNHVESNVAGSNAFALAYAANSVTATRSELGFRTDKSFVMSDAILTLRGRAAWAHDFNPDRAVAATFQSLPGSSFVVNGAAQASDSALVTAAAEVKSLNGLSLAATFEGEFSDVTRSYAGKGVVRYAW